MQMLLKLMHSSVKNVLDWSHNLIGMFLLTYLLQDNNYCKQANGWHRHKVYSPPPLPHTNPVFLPQATPCKLRSPISLFTLVGSLFVGYHLMGDKFKFYLDLIQCSKFYCWLSFYNDAKKAVCRTLPWQPNKFNNLAIVAPGTVEKNLMLLGLM